MRGGHLVAAVVYVAGAVLLAIVPFVATRAAESMNGWRDSDGNGMLDGFVNGSYDWFDINGGDWFRVAGALTTVVVGAVAVTVHLVWSAGRYRGPRAPWRRDEWGDPWSDPEADHPAV